MDTITVGDIKNSLLQELAGTVGDHTITFHFSEAKTSSSRTTCKVLEELFVFGHTFYRLSCQDLHLTPLSGEDLIVYKMLQTLVECRPQEDTSVHLPSCHTVVQYFVT